MGTTAASCHHLFVRRRHADFDTVPDVVGFGVSVGVKTVGGGRSDVVRMVSSVGGEGGDGGPNGIGKCLRIGQISGWNFSIQHGSLYGVVEWAAGWDAMHDFKRGNPPK